MAEVALSAVMAAGQHLGKLVVDEAKYLYQVQTKVDELHDELMWMQVFLEDIDARYVKKDKLVDMWISQISDLSYEAEDTVDKYIHRVSRKRKGGLYDTVKWLAFVSYNIGDAKTLHEVGSEIDALTQKIAKLTSRMQLYRINPKDGEGSSSSTSVTMKSKTIPPHGFVEPFVGRGKDIKEWVYKLAYGGSIVLSGPAGSGKTTLALAAYSDKNVANHYSHRVWIHVSKQFDVDSILREMLLGLSNDDIKTAEEIRWRNSPSIVFCTLHDLFENRRCFVVLNDVTNEAWSILKDGFRAICSTGKSQLLVTMRDGAITDLDGATLHELGPLTEEDGLYLLTEKACLATHTTDNDKKKQLLEEMLPTCCGQLSLIVQLGVLLSTLKDVEDWQTLKEGITAEDYEGCLRGINEMAYRFLPKQLKPFFLYLGMFPNNFKIRAKKLYPRWAAEGMLTAREFQGSIEELADGYLRELVHRGMVQLACPVNEKTGRVEVITLHDSMRDLCLEKAKKENFLNVVSSHADFVRAHFSEDDEDDKYHAPPNSRPSSVRRLAIHMDMKLQEYYRRNNDKMSDKSPYVRSLLLFVTEECGPKWVKEWIKIMSKNYPSVRVLIMDYAVGVIALPKEVGKFIHLRVLSFKGCNFGENNQLPSTIGNLRSLEILDLRVNRNSKIVIPNVFPNLKQLIRLYFPKDHLVARRYDKFHLHGLLHLKTLKNLDLRQCKEQSLFYSMEKLRIISVSSRVSEKDLPKLRYLVKHPRIQSGRLMKPLVLEVEGGVFNKDPNVLSGCNSLGRLRIWSDIRNSNIFSKVVKSLEPLRNLSELVLELTRLNEDPMPVLGKLPRLKILSLEFLSFLGVDMVCSSANDFPQLTHLTISNLCNLQRWSVEEGAMPNLLDLEMERCEKLKTISGSFANLADLKLKYLEGLEKWMVVESIPERTHVYLLCASNLKEVMIPEGSPPIVKIYYSPYVGSGDDDDNYNEAGES